MLILVSSTEHGEPLVVGHQLESIINVLELSVALCGCFSKCLLILIGAYAVSPVTGHLTSGFWIGVRLRVVFQGAASGVAKGRESERATNNKRLDSRRGKRGVLYAGATIGCNAAANRYDAG